MDPLVILDSHNQAKFWCFRHPWRNCVYDEAEEIIQLGYDDDDV